MSDTNIASRDPMSRAATRQLLWIAGAAIVGLAVLLAALGWAATLTGGGAAATHALDFKTRTVTTSIRNDIPQLDSSRSKDIESYNILHTVMEGLLRYDVNSNLVPGVAERWEVDGSRVTFYLRDNARWSDGKPVTAHDFVFAWRLAVLPETASEYAFLLYPVKNGEAINRGEIFRLITKPWNDEELKATLRQAFDHFDLKEEIKRLNQVTREQNFKLQDMNRNLEYKVRDRTKQLAEKHAELRTAYIQTIRALAEAVDAKDAYTRGHSERVGVYASKIAREMGFAKEFIEQVYIAGLLHDVGKIGIRDAIITKPDRLTPEEYAEIRAHPEIGARILEPVEMGIERGEVVPRLPNFNRRSLEEEREDDREHGRHGGVRGRLPEQMSRGPRSMQESRENALSAPGRRRATRRSRRPRRASSPGRAGSPRASSSSRTRSAP